MNPCEMLQQRKYTEVVSALERAEQPDDLLLLGEALTALGCYRKSVAALRGALGHGRTDAATHYQLACTYLGMRRLDWALKHLRRVGDEAGDALRSRTFSRRASIYASLGRFQTADKLLRQAFDTAPDEEAHSGALISASYVRMVAADFPSAVDLAGQALVLSPDQPAAHAHLADVHFRQNDSQRAVAAVTRATELDPEHVPARQALAETLIVLERWDEAAAHLRHALSLAQNSDLAETLYLLLGDCLYEVGLMTEAIAAYEAAGQRSRHQPSLGLEIADRMRTHAGGGRVRLRSIPRILQGKDGCGPCCLAMVLNAWGAGATPGSVAPKPGEAGLLASEMVEMARQHGFAAELVFGNQEILRRCLDAAAPVITFIGGAADAHCHVVVGCDEMRGILLVQATDGKRPIARLTREYSKLWALSGFMMLVIVPRARENVLRGLIATDRTALSLLAQFESVQRSDASKVALARATRGLCLSNPMLAHCGLTALGLAGAHEEALAWLDEAETQFSDQSWVPAMRAETLLEQGRVSEAAEAAASALAKNRDDWLARLSISQAYQEQERWGLALRHLRMALGVVYREVHVQYQFARLLQVRELWDAAAEHYEATVEFAPRLVHALCGLITVYLRQQRYDEAKALLPRAEQLADVHAYAWNVLALAYGQLGNLEEARRCFDRAVFLHLDDPTTRTYLAELMLARGETAEAIAELEHATRQSEDSPSAWFALGRALWRVGRMQDAIMPLERAAALAPHDGAALHHLGRLYASMGRLEEASLCLSEALRARPHDGEIQRELISVHQRQRRSSPSH